MAAGRRTNGSASETSSEQSRAHGLRVMSGRDPDEQHRVATPLELWPGLVTLQLFREVTQVIRCRARWASTDVPAIASTIGYTSKPSLKASSAGTPCIRAPHRGDVLPRTWRVR
jgi:hypothetical protein